jgi:hypothetical protein
MAHLALLCDILRSPSSLPTGLVNHMRHLCFAAFCFCFFVSAAIAQTVRFPLPKAHVWELKSKQVCNPVGSAEIRAAKDTAGASENILVDAGRGTHRLEITLADKELIVSLDGATPEKYRIVANTTGVVTAVLVGDIEPTISTISIDKITSYVVWSATEPRDFTRDVARHASALLTCSSVQP